ncbi:MAG: LEA type 2 family protein [Treponema sp.]|jgi:LEA14-like dessication related protein|nr:LEA type 2 family protein [Treponema sp.]
MKNMNKPVLAKTALALAVIALALTTCQSLGSIFSEPRFSLRSMDLTGISFTGVDLLCTVNVENPNPIDIPFPEIDWEFFVNANSFVKGIVKNDKSIKSQSVTGVDIPLSVTYADLFNAVKSLQNTKEADYLLSLGAKFPLPILGDKVFHLEHGGKLPVLSAPSLSFKGISVKNVSLTRLDFELNWEVENKNSFAINVKDLSYNFAVNNSQWASGKVPGAPRIPPDQKVLIPLSFSINSLAMVRDITGIITMGTDVTYACGGNMNLGGDLPLLSDFNIPFNYAGTTRLRR